MLTNQALANMLAQFPGDAHIHLDVGPINESRQIDRVYQSDDGTIILETVLSAWVALREDAEPWTPWLAHSTTDAAEILDLEEPNRVKIITPTLPCRIDHKTLEVRSLPIQDVKAYLENYKLEPYDGLGNVFTNADTTVILY